MKEVENNTINNQSIEEVDAEFRKGLAAQKTELDRMWYMINYTALTSMLENTIGDLNIKDRVNESEDENGNFIDYDELSQERINELEEKFRQENPLKTFTKEEEKRLRVPLSAEAAHKKDLNSAEGLDDIRRDYFTNDTFEGSKQHFMNLGVIGAKVYHEIGKQYKEWLGKLPENDPNREAKAMYLAQNTDSEGYYKANALSNVIKEISLNHKTNYKYSTVLNDPEKFKKMTVGEFFDLTYMPKKYREQNLDNFKHYDNNVSEKSSIYDVLLKKETLTKQKKKEQGEVTVEEVQASAMDYYTKQAFSFWAKAGSDSIRNNLSPEDRKLIDIGETLASDFEYRHPKEIKEWIENEAPKMIKEVKVDGLNKTYANLSKAVSTTKAVDFHKTDPIVEGMPKQGKNISELDKYISRHSGALAVQGSEEEKRVHLAKLMSADTYKRNGMNASVKAIHDFADELMKRKAFQNLSDNDVTKALTSPEMASRLQAKLYVKTFGVAPSKRQAYIDEMKMLKEHMMSSEKRTDVYKDFFEAVSKVASLKPDDKDFYAANDRLIKAIRDYTKGKKSVRRSDDGKARFDNALDAMAIVDKYIPGSRNFVNEQVERIRKVRDVEKGNKFYVDLKNYGAENAKNKHNERQLAQQAGMKK